LAGSITRASRALTGALPFLRFKVLFFIVKTLIHPLFSLLHNQPYSTCIPRYLHGISVWLDPTARADY
jgi:hypothetical protein